MTGAVAVTVPDDGTETPPAVVLELLYASGDEVAAGSVVARLALDKADVEVVAPVSGRIRPTVAVGAVLDAGATVAVVDPVGPAPKVPAAGPSPEEDDRSGAEAVATTRDTGSPDEPAGGSQTEPLTRLRRTIARTMMTSLATTAQRTSVVSVDVTRLMQLRTRWNPVLEARLGVRVSPFHLLTRAVCLALPRHPVMHCWLDRDAEVVTFHAQVDLGIAVDTPTGLVVVTMADAGSHDVVGLARVIRELAARARRGQLTPTDVRRGSFTLSNTGSNGTSFGTPILTPPQVGLLATYAVAPRAVVQTRPDGTEAVAIRSLMNLALTYDHRAVDGADAGRFLQDLSWVVSEHDFDAELEAATR